MHRLPRHPALASTRWQKPSLGPAIAVLKSQPFAITSLIVRNAQHSRLRPGHLTCGRCQMSAISKSHHSISSQAKDVFGSIMTMFGTWVWRIAWPLPRTARNAHAMAHGRVADRKPFEDAIEWWEALTGNGGEGMVVKPRQFIARGKKGLIQPALKVRGREYLRIIYGPEYDAPENLVRLRERGLGGKRNLALREFAPRPRGIEAVRCSRTVEANS